MEVKTVQRAIRELEGMGMLIRRKRKAPGIRNSNQYFLTGPMIDGESIRDPKLALHGYLRMAANRNSKRYKELRGANSNDGEPPF